MSTKSVPVLFIPGLFGCMSSQLIPHTGVWQFGFARHMYDPFVTLLSQNGFHLSKDFFVLYYEWHKSPRCTVEDYLLPLLKKIKRLTGQSKCHVIAHGTGGLIARTYLQSASYEHDFSNMIFVGTPHKGFCTVFPYLSGGELTITCKTPLDFVTLYLRMHLYNHLKPHSPLPETLHTTFPALKSFLPCQGMGDYLYYLWDDTPYFIPYTSMHHPNTFLDTLNTQFEPSLFPHTHFYSIAGDGHKTLSGFEVAPFCQGNRWLDGKVIACDHTTEGDGVHLLSSALGLPSHHHVIHCHYEELLIASASIYMPLLTS